MKKKETKNVIILHLLIEPFKIMDHYGLIMDHYGPEQEIHTMKQDRLKQELKKYLNSKLTYPLQTVEDISIESILKVYGSQKT